MRSLIRAELLKLHTTRMFWGYMAAAVGFVPVSIALAMASGTGAASLESSEGLRNVLSAASAGSLLVLLVGISLVTGEFRHNTVTTTFLVTPRRGRVLAAKLGAGAVVGVGVAVAASLLTLAVGLPWLAARNVDVSLGVDVGAPLLGGLVSTVLAAVSGVGLGALMRNQTLAITVVLVWTSVVDALLVGFLPSIGRWLPGGAASALAGTATAEGGLLPFWGAALLLAGYALAFATAGTRLVARRDIT
jgi:ABC-2 type transport system permease protein